jgi:hypothetical protein
MDLSEAISSHLKRFSEFHIELNSYIKLSVAALDHLYASSGDPRELSDCISDLIVNAGERWTPTKFLNPRLEISNLKSQLTESAIMRVYSSFDVFLDEINGSYDQYISKSPLVIDDSAYGPKVQQLFSRFDWDIKSIDYLLPVYHFYNTSRHCVVHRMGKANKELAELSNHIDFLNAIRTWPTVAPGRQLSPPPKVNDDHKLDLRPHHAITYSDVCYRIASEVNQKLFGMIGREGLVESVAKDHILRCEALRYPACKNVYSYLRYILTEEYGVKNIEYPGLRAALEQARIRQICYRKYESMRADIA